MNKDIQVSPDGLSHFEVTTRDKTGKPASDPAIPVVVTVKNAADGTGKIHSTILTAIHHYIEAHVSVNPKEDGIYDVAIAPPAPGEYEVTVALKDASDPSNLIGTPFMVNLAPPGTKCALLKRN